jgi:hypothetical protein
LTKQQTHPVSCTYVAKKTTKNKKIQKLFFDSSNFPNLLNIKTKVFLSIPCQENNKKQATQNKTKQKIHKRKTQNLTYWLLSQTSKQKYV